MKLIGKNSYFVKALAVMLCAIIAFSSFQLGGIFTVSALNADLATVTLLTGASNEANTIEGNGTSEVFVTINEAELEWVPANEIRTQDGWWVGIKVTAPEGFSADAQYKRTISPTDTTVGEFKSFADYKDGENYIELWFSVSPETLDSNESLGMIYQFDWNADDDCEQVINFTVESSEDKIVLNKGGETVYPLDISDVKIDGSSKTHDGQALFAKVENVDDFDVKYVDKDGEPFEEAPSITNVGSITFDVVLYKADYEVYRKEITLTVTEADLEGVIIAAPEKLQYDGTSAPLFTVEGVKKDDKITYIHPISNEEIEYVVTEYDEKLAIGTAIYTPGLYSIEVTVSRANYIDLKETVTYNITPGTLDTIGLTIEVNENLEYTGEEQTLLSATIKDSDVDKENYDIKYQVVENGTAFNAEGSFDENATATNSGSYTVYIVAFKANYNDKLIYSDETAEPPIPYSVTISKADIGATIDENKVYNAKYDKQAHYIIADGDIDSAISGIIDGDTVSYSVKEDGTYFPEMPTVTTVAHSGQYFIKIHRNDNYEDQIIKVNVVVERANLAIKFGATPNVSYKDKDNNWFTYAIDKIYFIDKDNKEIDADDIEHTVVYSDNCNFANVASDGTVTYENIGDVTVFATLDGDYDNYNNVAKAEYKVKIYNVDAPKPTISGDNEHKEYDGNNVKCLWYSGNVVITPADGWKIIEAKEDIVQNNTIKLGQTWSTSISKTEEAVYDDVKVAFKKIQTGEISKVYTVKDLVADFAIDKTAPLINKENKIIFDQNNDGAFAELLNILSFGTFFNENLTVTVNAIDVFPDSTIDGSGIKEYQLIFENENDKFVFAQADKKFVIKGEDYAKLENFKGSVSVVVIDNVKNYETYSVNVNISNLDNTDFMIENDAPVISDIIQESALYFVEDEDKFIHKDAFNFVFEVDDITDKEYSGINCVKAVVNGTEVLFADFSKKYTDYEKFSLKVNPVAQTVNGIEIEKWNDGKLNIVVSAYDNAGNVAEQKSIDNIYFDQTAPIISGFDFTLTESIDVEKDEGVYKSVTVEDYGFYFKEDVTVTIKVEEKTGEFESTDGISGAETVNYKTVDVNGEVIEGILPVNNDGTVTFTINKDFKGQIYAYATDRVGNKPTDCRYCLDDKVDADGFVHPNAAIVEKLSKHNEEEHITITAPDSVGTQNNAYNFKFNGNIDKVKDYADSQLVPLYNSDVTFNVAIKDTYSGIRNVKWTIYEGEDPVKTTKEIEISNDGTISGDKDGWNIIKKDINLVTGLSNSITVSGNHNNMVLLVELTDRAGNTSYDYYVFGIDKTLPTIDVVYDDDVAKNDDAYSDHFNTNRTATITITERNFDAKNVVFKITNSDKVIPSVDLNDKKSWTEKIDSTDLDKTTYTAKINYTADGDYTFEISFADNAKNSNSGVNYGDSIAPTEFTIDKTVPTVSVTYDNNSVLNGNYYKADRVATITVNEHNFDANRVVITGTASDDGSSVSFPSISGWKSEGDVHTTTIAYKTDAKYSFDIAITDKAANETVDFAAQEFYIDKTNPVLSISGIVDQSANNSDGDIGFTITATDTNFDGVTPVLRAVIMKDGKFDVVDITDAATTAEIKNGLTYTVKNIENDGIYSITCTLVDKAGNAFSEVILEDGEGATYIEKRSGENKLITFSVNRDGSTFNLDKYTKELVDTYYVQEVTKDVTIVEINADPILKNKVMLNGKVLVEKKDYKVTLSNDDGSWYKYTYTINKELFDEEGEYNIVVTSTDKATNEAFSDVKGLTIKFVTDRTAPIVTVSGIKTDGRYKTNKQTVKLIPSDDGGSLKSLIVRTVDNDGKVIKELINLSGKDLIAAIEKGEISFELGQGLYQNVQIICEDMAGNVFGLDDDELYVDITISTNSFMIFWANRVLRWGTITGVALLTAAIIFLIVYKKRKKK